MRAKRRANDHRGAHAAISVARRQRICALARQAAESKRLRMSPHADAARAA
jgi:hypothetical protein